MNFLFLYKKTHGSVRNTIVIALLFSVLLFKDRIQMMSYNIEPISSFSQAEDVLISLDQNALVIFDVDDTLLLSNDPTFQERNVKSLSFAALAANLYFWYPQFRNSAFRYDIANQAMLESDRILIEPLVTNLIESLLARKIKVIALTRMALKNSDAIANVMEWRYQDLLSHNINFDESFPELGPCCLSSDHINGPEFHKGIIKCGKMNKGRALECFLESAKFRPSQIILFDNTARNLATVGYSAQKLGIDYHGFLYEGSDQYPNNFNIRTAYREIEALVSK